MAIYIPDDEWFDLEVNDDVDPMEVVRFCGSNASNWQYLGPEFEGKKTYRVKLVRLGGVPNLAQARAMANNQGYRLIEGQACKAVAAKFPKLDDRELLIIFGGAQWQFSGGRARVPGLLKFGDGWRSDFFWSGNDFLGHWRWAVVELGK